MGRKPPDISERLLEAILMGGQELEPRDFDPAHEVDRYILEFCDWLDESEEDNE